MQIKLLPENERPVEKACILGIGRLTNSELLALIIHTGTKNKSAIRLAEDVLALCPTGIGRLGESSLEDLMEVDGIGTMKAVSYTHLKKLQERNSYEFKSGVCRGVGTATFY